MYKERIRIGILMGGPSAERDVSLASGCHVVEILDRTRYEIHPIEVGEDRKWYLHHIDSPLLSPTRTIGKEAVLDRAYTPPSTTYSELVTARVLKGRVDVLFPVLHGPGGEDGTIQGYLEILEIPYVGSGVLASALTMDKARCKVFLRAMGLPTPDWTFFSRPDWESRGGDLNDYLLESFPNGMVVKPNNQGSSVGMSILDPGEDPGTAIQQAFQLGVEVLVENRVSGREFTCGVIGKETAEALPVTEIKTRTGFFDYASKYQPGGAEEITPADISEELTREIQTLALRAHRVCGCAGITRTDFLLDDNKPVILEVNTIPGMTRMSLIPRACAAAGLDFEAILDRVIGEALFKEEVLTNAR